MADRIYKVTEYDMLYMPITKGNLYVCSDSKVMYQDISNIKRTIFNAEVLDTDLYRLYTLRPVNGKHYYVWETNCLYLYSGGWKLIIGDNKQANLYYDGVSGITESKNPCCNINESDGSLVVRDNNGIIKGKFYIDQNTNGLVLSSFTGGELKLFPDGAPDVLGDLYLNPIDIIEETVIDDSTGVESKDTRYVFNKGLLRFIGSLDIISRDGKDSYITKIVDNESKKYKIYTEEDFEVGEWELSAEDIIQKLNSYKPQPIDLNVKFLNGNESTDFAENIHSHICEDITDLSEYIETMLKTRFKGNGINVSYDESDDKVHLDPNLTLRFIGGITGLARVTSDNTLISLQVDPLMHTHELGEIKGWEDFLENYTNRIENTVTKDQIIGEARVPNNDEELLLKLNSFGSLSTDITGNANTASKLHDGLTISISDGATGSTTFDGSEDVNIVLSVDPDKHSHEQYVLVDNIGITVAPLDSNNKIPTQNLPDSVLGNLQYQGIFDPSAGVPSTDPIKGQYWVAQGSGEINGQEYISGDWIIYNGTAWEYLDNSGCVQSINGMSGVVEINAGSIGAISTDDIYNPDDPKVDKIVKTVIDSDTGEIVLPIGVSANSIPIATSQTVGVVRVGEGLNIDSSGILSISIDTIDDGELVV